MTIKKRGLGRGLDVLLTSRVVERENEASIVALDIDVLQPNTYQPRVHFDPNALEELAASIKAQGLLQPILVRPLEASGQYEIVAGERRWRACRLAGLPSIDCIVRPMDQYESMTIALIENLQREDLNPMEEARALGQIKEHLDLTQEELADKVGRSRPAVANCLRLLKLPEEVQNMLEKQSLSTGHARALLGLEDTKIMVELAKRVITKGLTVRETETLVKKYRCEKPDQKEKNESIPVYFGNAFRALENQYRITHRGTETKGKVVFAYTSAEERAQLNEMLNKIARENN